MAHNDYTRFGRNNNFKFNNNKKEESKENEKEEIVTEEHVEEVTTEEETTIIYEDNTILTENNNIEVEELSTEEVNELEEDEVMDVNMSEDTEKEVVTTTLGTVNCKRLNVREKPDTNSDVVVVLEEGTIVKVHVDESTTEDFYKISKDNPSNGLESSSIIIGYCMKQFIKIN